jgi:hypothetical protein
MPRETVDPSGAPPDDVAVVGAGDGHVRPGVESATVLDEGVGATELQHHARAHLGLVEVLGARVSESTSTRSPPTASAGT